MGLYAYSGLQADKSVNLPGDVIQSFRLPQRLARMY